MNVLQIKNIYRWIKKDITCYPRNILELGLGAGYAQSKIKLLASNHTIWIDFCKCFYGLTHFIHIQK